jgi:hypothetical protein
MVYNKDSTILLDMNNLDKAILKRPPDLEMAALVFSETTSITLEQGREVSIAILPTIAGLQKSIDKLQQTVENTQRLTAPNIARYFLVNPHVLEDFEVKEDDEKDTVQILYKGSYANNVIRRAYNKITAELIKTFGCKDVSFKTMSEAILKAHDWRMMSANDSVDISILNVAYSFNKLFTIAEIKKVMPSLYWSNDEITELLVNNGYTLKTYPSNRIKYFKKP